MNILQDYTAGHRYVLDVIGRAAKFADPVAFTPGSLQWPLLKSAKKGDAIPIDGVLVRDWNAYNRRVYPGLQLGARLYTIEGITFVVVYFEVDYNVHNSGLNFFAVDKADYLRLYRIAQCCSRHCEPPTPAPILPSEQAGVLWKNTIGYLESDNLDRIRAYGGRARRSVLLTGVPGNGKTMACRWIWDECRRRSWEYHIITPDSYRQARESCNRVEAVRALFSVQRRGVVFFDDMDIALRDRDTVAETEDQSIFLTALDGIQIKEGVAYVFTTNCKLDLIDRAFKRPGRIDVVLHFQQPNADLRRQLVERWHPDIRAHLCLDTVVSETNGYSFAELDELKNLLIMHFTDTGTWDWSWATRQFQINREEFQSTIRKRVGFNFTPSSGNGHDMDDY